MRRAWYLPMGLPTGIRKVRCRVGLKSWIDRERRDIGIDRQFNPICLVVVLAHGNDELAHTRILFDYMRTHRRSFGATRNRARNRRRCGNSVRFFPHAQPCRPAAAIACASYVSYCHGTVSCLFKWLYYSKNMMSSTSVFVKKSRKRCAAVAGHAAIYDKKINFRNTHCIQIGNMVLYHQPIKKAV